MLHLIKISPYFVSIDDASLHRCFHKGFKVVSAVILTSVPGPSQGWACPPCYAQGTPNTYISAGPQGLIEHSLAASRPMHRDPSQAAKVQVPCRDLGESQPWGLTFLIHEKGIAMLPTPRCRKVPLCSPKAAFLPLRAAGQAKWPTQQEAPDLGPIDYGYDPHIPTEFPCYWPDVW